MNILLVDDSEDMRMLVALFLKALGHEVESAKNGIEAVDLVQMNDYDVIFMDMRMPQMDGYDATKAIRSFEKLENKPRTPVIALTAFSMKEEIEKSLKAGCDTHLVKPVTKASLEDVLKELKSVPKDTEEKIVADEYYSVCIDEEIQDLVPAYLEKRKDEQQRMLELLNGKNFEELRSLGHKVKGSGGGYGFQGLSLIGAKIEESSKAEDGEKLTALIELYADFLKRVKITYE